MADSAASSTTGDLLPLKAQRTAMLVIHGIGEQNPYETLDSFARGIACFLWNKCSRKFVIKPNRIEHDDWVEVMIRVDKEKDQPSAPDEFVDIYEYYWASCTEGKISYRSTLRWLIKTDFSPIQHLTENMQLEQTATGKKPSQILGRELARIFLLYLPFLALLGWLLAWVPGWIGKPSALDVLRTAGFASSAVLAIVIAGVIEIGVVLSCGRKKKAHSGPYPRGYSAWLVGELLVGVLILGIGSAIAAVTHVHSSDVWHAFCVLTWIRIHMPLIPRQLHLIFAGGLWATYAALLYFVVDYVGDVALYVNADQKAESYAVRSAILNGSTAALTRILKDSKRNYDQIILAGHSLGSVIAYDTIDELLNQSAAAMDQLEPRPDNLQIHSQELEKLRGFVTFGSPLDKIYYFFRDHVADRQAIRAQVLSYLHSFRKIQSKRDYGEFKFNYKSNRLPGLRWLNAWAKTDIVSGALHFYTDVERREFKYLKPVLSHLSYWEDPNFYEYIGDALLVEGVSGVPHRHGAAAR